MHPLKKYCLRFLLITVTAFLLTACKKKEDDAPSLLYFPPVSSTEWETKSPADLGWNTANINSLLDLLRNNGTRAFILLKDGKIVIEEYFGNNIAGTAPFNASSSWYWASAGKTLTSFVVGKAQEDGHLVLSDKTSDYLGTGWTSLTPQKEALITIKHQLTMSTGLDDGVSDNHSFLPKDLIYKADAGTRWAYHNGPYTLLEKVVKAAVQTEFETYFNSVLRDKTGMDGTWIWNGNDHVFYSTARSMARFGLLILNKGDWDQQHILNDKNYMTAMVTPSQEINKSYGYLWWLNGKQSFMMPDSQIIFPGSVTPNGPADMYSAMGKNGQYLSIVPSKNIVLVRMGEDPSDVQVPFLFLDDIWEKLNLVIK